MFLRYCCAHLLNYTVPVPYRTVRYIGPCSSSACTTVLHSYRTLFTSKLRARTVEVQYSSVPYVFSHKHGTVVHIYYSKLRYRYRTAVYGTQAPFCLLVLIVRVRQCTVLYCTVLCCARTVLYFKQYSPCWYEYRQLQYRYRSIFEYRSVSYRSTGVSTVPHIEILQYATNTRTVAGYCNIYI